MLTPLTGAAVRPSRGQLDELLERIQRLTRKEQDEVKALALAKTAQMAWVPNPGPQTDAFFSTADETFYGGAAGGGKTSLLCGLALTAHRRSILFRREYPQIKGMIDEVSRILGGRDGYNAQDKLWRLPDGRELEFGSVQYEDDKEKYQGRAHDLIGFDEITHFTESQYRFLIGWARSSTVGQRVRVVAAGNPPLTAEGAWVVRYWAPWLDPVYPKPAQPGELRWFTTVDGKDLEVDGIGPYEIGGRPVYARSRTFIASRLEDNPDLMAAGYASVVEAMPEPMRTMLREGRFDVASGDQAMQVIPTAWILAAQNRWDERGFENIAMTAMALDPAGGGRDDAVLAPRYGGWYAPLVTANGPETADGSATAAMVVKYRRDGCPVVVDVGGGYGGAVLVRLDDNGIPHHRFNGAEASVARTKDGQLGFVNKRAEAWWRFREELDPDQEGGSAVALPPDPELRADLASPCWSLKARGIQIESKDELRSRLGRSPGKGDAVVMALSEGAKAAVHAVRHKRPLTVNLGHEQMKRRR